jgi:hypothetical protein
MNLWSAREKSLHWVNNELKAENMILQDGFDYLGTLVDLFEKISINEGESETGQFCRISSITLAKSCHLLLGCYSLILDGLAQESGALLRTFIETYELLVYIRQDKSRINQILEDKLPPPGNIGKLISGEYKNLRESLSENASHFSYKPASVRHLFDKDIKIQPAPIHSLMVLRTNLQVFSVFQVIILDEAYNCLISTGFNANTLTDDVEKWCYIAAKIFFHKKFRSHAL